MRSQIRLFYFHPQLNIGLKDIRNAWLLETKPLKLIATIHQGSLSVVSHFLYRQISFDWILHRHLFLFFKHD